MIYDSLKSKRFVANTILPSPDHQVKSQLHKSRFKKQNEKKRNIDVSIAKKISKDMIYDS